MFMNFAEIHSKLDFTWAIQVKLNACMHDSSMKTFAVTSEVLLKNSVVQNQSVI